MLNTPPTVLDAIADSPAGRIHRARLADGRDVAAVQVVLVDLAAVRAASDRLRRLGRVSDPALTPVLAWWVDGSSVWYATELDEGLPFSRFPPNFVMSPQQSVALSLGILQGLAALYDEGLSHGALSAANVRVDNRGRVRLAGHPLAILRFPSDGDLLAEARIAGRLVCDAFGIPVERSSGPPRAIEFAAPALVVAARSIANGTLGHDVKAAAAILRETAGPLAGHQRLALGIEELGALVGGREPDRSAPPLRASAAADPAPLPRPLAAAVAPPRPPEAAPAPIPRTLVRAPSPDHFDDEAPAWQRFAVIGAIALVVLALIGGAVLASKGLFRNQPAASVKATPSPTPTLAPSPSPTGPFAVPAYAPAAAGGVSAVNLSKVGSCAVGAGCALEVQVIFQPQPQTHDINWSFKIFDRCASTTSDQPGGTVTAQPGWINTIGDTTFPLPPAKGQLAIVAISTAPDRAASQPLLVGAEGC